MPALSRAGMQLLSAAMVAAASRRMPPTADRRPAATAASGRGPPAAAAADPRLRRRQNAAAGAEPCRLQQEAACGRCSAWPAKSLFRQLFFQVGSLFRHVGSFFCQSLRLFFASLACLLQSC